MLKSLSGARELADVAGWWYGMMRSLTRMAALWACGTALATAGAHTGDVVLFVEGEDRLADAGACAPDGEQMRVDGNAAWFEETYGHAPNGRGALEFPNEGCWAQWNFKADAEGLALLIGSYPPNAGFTGSTECVVWHVEGPANLQGRTAEHCGAEGHGIYVDLPVLRDDASRVVISQGDWTIKVTAEFTVGPAWANAYVDRVGFALCDVCETPSTSHDARPRDGSVWSFFGSRDPANLALDLMHGALDRVKAMGLGEPGTSGGAVVGALADLLVRHGVEENRLPSLAFVVLD